MQEIREMDMLDAGKTQVGQVNMYNTAPSSTKTKLSRRTMEACTE